MTMGFAINFIRQDHLRLLLRHGLRIFLAVYLIVQGIVLVGMLLTGVTMDIRRSQLQSLIQEKFSFVPSADQIRSERRALKTEVQNQKDRLNAVISSQKGRFRMANKLASLKKTLPSRTWITSLRGGSRDRTLTIRAAHWVSEDGFYKVVAKNWSEALRSDPIFSQGLQSLELKSSSQKSSGRNELYSFELTARWRA